MMSFNKCVESLTITTIKTYNISVPPTTKGSPVALCSQFPLPPEFLAATDLLSVTIRFALQFLSLSIILLRSNRVVVGISSSFLFIAG